MEGLSNSHKLTKDVFSGAGVHSVVCEILVARVDGGVCEMSGGKSNNGILRLVKRSDVCFGMEFSPTTTSRSITTIDDVPPLCCDIDEVTLRRDDVDDSDAQARASSDAISVATDIVITFTNIGAVFHPRLAKADPTTSLELYAYFVARRDECVRMCWKALRVHALLRDVSSSGRADRTTHTAASSDPSNMLLLSSAVAVEAAEVKGVKLEPCQEQQSTLSGNGEGEDQQPVIDVDAATPRSETERLLLSFLQRPVLGAGGGDCQLDSIIPSPALARCFYCERYYNECMDQTAESDAVDSTNTAAAPTTTRNSDAAASAMGITSELISEAGVCGVSRDKRKSELTLYPEYQRYCLDAAASRRSAPVGKTITLPESPAAAMLIHPYVPRCSRGGYVMLCRPCYRSYLYFRTETGRTNAEAEEANGQANAAVVAAMDSGMDVESTAVAEGLTEPEQPTRERDYWESVPTGLTEFESPFANSAALVLRGEYNEEICCACSITPRELLLCSSCPRSYCHNCVNKLLPVPELKALFNEDVDWSCVCCKWEEQHRHQSARLAFGADYVLPDLRERSLGGAGSGALNSSPAAVAVDRVGMESKRNAYVASHSGDLGSDDDFAIQLKPRARGVRSNRPRLQQTGRSHNTVDAASMSRAAASTATAAATATGTGTASAPMGNTFSGGVVVATSAPVAVELLPVNKEVDEMYYFSQYIKLMIEKSEQKRAAAEAATEVAEAEAQGSTQEDGRHDTPVETVQVHGVTGAGAEKPRCRSNSSRGRKFKRLKVIPVQDEEPTEDYCFLCKDGGELMECDHLRPESVSASARRRGGGGSAVGTGHCGCIPGHPVLAHCTKVYHQYCLEFSLKIQLPGDENIDWRCPRHYCSVCALHMNSSGGGKGETVTYFMCQSCPISICSTCSLMPPYKLSQVFGSQRYAKAKIGAQGSNVGQRGATVYYQPIVCHSCLLMVDKCIEKGDLERGLVENQLFDGAIMDFPK